MERQYSPATSSHSRRALQARCSPSPCTRLSRARTTTRAPPPTRAISGRCALACPPKGTSATPVGFPRSLPFACPGRRPALPLRACRDAHADRASRSLPGASIRRSGRSPAHPGTRSPL